MKARKPQLAIALTLTVVCAVLAACSARPASGSAGRNSYQDRCSLTPHAGECRAAMPRFFYNSASGRCQSFLWGGCGGVVPFQTLEQCRTACENAGP